MLWNLVELFFPEYCLACSETLVKGESLVCTTCCYALPQTTYHQEPSDNLVAQKFYGKVPITYAIARYRFQKSGKVQAILHSLKYKNKPMIGKIIGKRYGVILKQANLEKKFDLVVPVPLHRSRLRQRGYNQSDYFAQGLAEGLNIPWSNKCLQRTRATSTQTAKNQLERLRNVEGAFFVLDDTLVRGKHLLLVDDVVTTGATLEACSMELLAAGSKEISVATIAATI